MHPRQQAKAAQRAPAGAFFDPSVEYSSFRPFEELLEQKRIAREQLLRRAEFIWSDSGLTKCLYDTLMRDFRDIVHVSGLKKCNEGLPWQRKVELAFLQLSHGGHRRATAVYFEYWLLPMHSGNFVAQVGGKNLFRGFMNSIFLISHEPPV